MSDAVNDRNVLTQIQIDRLFNQPVYSRPVLLTRTLEQGPGPGPGLGCQGPGQGQGLEFEGQAPRQ